MDVNSILYTKNTSRISSDIDLKHALNGDVFVYLFKLEIIIFVF